MTQSKFLNILEGECKDIIEEPAIEFPFELDNFQKHANYRISIGENVIVTAKTGSGKTLPAIYACADSVKKNKKIIYTCPIKTLSNQKYLELKEKFGKDLVGVLTGDIKYNPSAQILVCVTEILKNVLMSNSTNRDININEIDKVIYDEIHYCGESGGSRAHVWESCITIMPPEIQIIGLSATISNQIDFASWMADLKQRPMNLIPTSHRVVPLTHFYYNFDDNELVEIVTSKNKFQNYHKITKKTEIINKLINPFCQFLKDNNLFNTLIFVYSRKKTEKICKMINISLVTSEESSEILNIFDNQISKYKKIYENTLQYNEIRQLCSKGIAYHHSGVTPILKEIIEILFGKNLIKILVCTETFACGCNFPTKTVVFLELNKFADGERRFLKCDEYIQQAGRAGRRGLDKTGTVIILPVDKLLKQQQLSSIMTGKSSAIKSKFHFSYNFILKLLHDSQDKDLFDFIGKSLMSLEQENDLNGYMLELLELKDEIKKEEDKFNNKDMLDKCLEYDKINNLLNQKNKKIKQNQLKRYKTQIQQIKKTQDFDNYYKKFLSFNKKYDKIQSIEKSTKYLKTCNKDDINNILNFLEKNKYIELENPIKLSYNSFIDHYKDFRLTIKGLIASEMSEANEIIFTEIIHQKLLDSLKPEEIVAVLSLFIQERDDGIDFLELKLPKHLKDVLNKINAISYNMSIMEENHNIYIETDWSLFLGFIEPAYFWAKGKPINYIYNLTEIYDGNFIKNIIRINNIVNDLKIICDITNNDILQKKIEDIEVMLIRDQVTDESLYVS